MSGEDDKRRYRRESVVLPVELASISDSRRVCDALHTWTIDVSPRGMKVRVVDNDHLARIAGVEVWLKPPGSLGSDSAAHLGCAKPRYRTADGLIGFEFIDQPCALLLAPSFVGVSRAMTEIKDLIAQFSSCGFNVLISGETGTGKNVLARAIHRHSMRVERPFMSVNCASIPPTLFESELFGHEKGAFTGASKAAPGYLKLADGGTLLLDEIGELSLQQQAKLLHVIEEKRFRSVGGTEFVPLRCRIMAATNIDIERAVAEGRFRRDLFYRLAEINIGIPPLRTRQEDIPLLACHFMRKHSPNGPGTLSEEQVRELCRYPWPGNARELENHIKRLMVFGEGCAPGSSLQCAEPGIEALVRQAPNPKSFIHHGKTLGEYTQEITAMFEYRAIVSVLRACQFDRTEAADRLGCSYRTLLRKMKRYSIEA